jgi:hypothetical protein
MVSKKTHENLIKKWKKVSPKVYQLRTKRVIDRMKWLDKHLHLLDGLNVLEVGSNSGLFAIDICKHCNRYVGLEPKVNYYKQLLITEKHIHEICDDFGWDYKCEFYNMTLDVFTEYYLHLPDVLILIRVIYYLSDKEIEKLKQILKSCKYALVFCGSAKDRKNNSYGFHKPENVAKFFEDCGMKFEVDLVHDRYFAGVAITQKIVVNTK